MRSGEEEEEVVMMGVSPMVLRGRGGVRSGEEEKVVMGVSPMVLRGRGREESSKEADNPVSFDEVSLREDIILLFTVGSEVTSCSIGSSLLTLCVAT